MSQHTGRAAARPVFDRATWFFVGLALAAAIGLGVRDGWQAVVAPVRDGLTLFVMIAPMILMGLFLGGLVKAMADPEKIAPLLGARSGLIGVLLATGLGAVTPGGPFAAFPIVFALFAAGADVGAVVAFLTGWALIAVHRIVIWELPLIGPEFVALRVLVSLPLPVVAGLVARRLSARVAVLRVAAPHTGHDYAQSSPQAGA